MTMLLSEQLRPIRFDDLTLPNLLKMRLQKMYDTRNVMNMLFYGKPGTGKTTAAKIFTTSELFDAIEINGSLQTSVDEIRSTVQNFAHSCSLLDSSKICFIDEAEYLSKNAQAGLRSLIESSSYNCRYIFTANDLSKIHSALCSRLIPICFDMKSANRLLNALTKECSQYSCTLKKSPELEELLNSTAVSNSSLKLAA